MQIFMHKYVKMLQKCKKVRCSTLSMSTPVTSLFFFKPIIGGGGCLRGVWALGAGRGKAAPPQPPSLGRPHGLGVACVGLVLAARVRRGTPVGRLSGGLRCCVRPMPICIVCAECLPVRNGKPSGACFDCDLLKHGQHKPRPSKGWSVGPLMLVGLPPHKRTDVGAVGIRRSGVLVAACGLRR